MVRVYVNDCSIRVVRSFVKIFVQVLHNHNKKEQITVVQRHQTKPYTRSIQEVTIQGNEFG